MLIRRRSFLGLAGLAVASATGLSACGGADQPQATTTPTPAGPKPKLSQWYHAYPDEGVEAAVKRYAAAYPDGTVTVRWNPGDYEKLVTTALSNGPVPDVFEWVNGPTLEMIKADQVLDLTELIGADKSQFSAPVLAAMTWQDRIYAIPQSVDMQLLYYRKSLLDQVGVQPPSTLEQLTTAAQELTAAGLGGFFAGNDGGIGALSKMLIWASGQEQVNPEQTTIGFDNPAFYAALVAFTRLYRSAGLVKQASADWTDPKPFINGEAAMQWGQLSSLPDIQTAFGDDFGVAPFPAIGEAGRQAIPFAAYSATVSAKGSDPAAAGAFAKWLWIDQADFQVDFANSYGTHLPAKPDLLSKADKVATGPGAEAAKFVNELGHADDKLWTPAMDQALVAAVTAVVTKKANPQTEVNKVAVVATKEIRRVAS